MAQGDILKRYLDAGLAFTQMTRERAEAIVSDLVKEGEIRRKEAQERIEELVERSQRNTEELLAIIRREVNEQIKALGLEDLAKRAGVGGKGATADNPTSVGDNVSETPNSADSMYPAPPEAAAEATKSAKEALASAKSAKKASAKVGGAKAGGAKAGGVKKASAAKKTTKAAKKG